jgi:RNase P protein component
MLKYELETASYYQQLRELKKRQEQQSDKDSVSETPSISTTSVLPPQSPLPPKLPPAVLQYQLRNTRQFPPTVDAPHPAFRIGFILSKKMISKLATDRNFGRKKLSAAAEMVFRDHAREGYEYLIFGKPACITTPQAELIELMKKGLNNPALYGEKTSPRNSISTHTSSNDNCINSSGDTGAEKGAKGSLTSTLGPKDIVTIRWMNNRPPLRKTWWKHALPNPLGRVQQSDAYLDRHCVKTPKAPAMSQDRGVQ